MSYVGIYRQLYIDGGEMLGTVAGETIKELIEQGRAMHRRGVVECYVAGRTDTVLRYRVTPNGHKRIREHDNGF